MRVNISAVHRNSEHTTHVATGEIESLEVEATASALIESGTVIGVYPGYVIVQHTSYVPISRLTEEKLPDDVAYYAYSFWNDTSQEYTVVRDDALHAMRGYDVRTETHTDGAIIPIWSYPY